MPQGNINRLCLPLGADKMVVLLRIAVRALLISIDIDRLRMSFFLIIKLTLALYND